MTDNQIFVYVRNQKASLTRRFFLVFGEMNEMQMVIKCIYGAGYMGTARIAISVI